MHAHQGVLAQAFSSVSCLPTNPAGDASCPSSVPLTLAVCEAPLQMCGLGRIQRLILLRLHRRTRGVPATGSVSAGCLPLQCYLASH